MKSLLGQVLTVHDQININADSIVSDQSLMQRMKHTQTNVTTEQQIHSAVVSQKPFVLPNQLSLKAQSAGFHAGNFAKIEFAKDGYEQLVCFYVYHHTNCMIVDSGNLWTWIERQYSRSI